MNTKDEKLIEQLEQYLALLDPRQTAGPIMSEDGRQIGYNATSHYKTACSNREALEATAKIERILDNKYDSWKQKHNETNDFRFSQQYDATAALIGILKSEDEINQLLEPPNIEGRFHPEIWNASKHYLEQGDYIGAVQAAAKTANRMLQEKIGRDDISDTKLCQESFGAPKADKRTLAFPDAGTEETQKSLRFGVMSFGAGCFSAIRNPLSHEPNNQIDLEAEVANEQLSAFSLLARWIDNATVVGTS